MILKPTSIFSARFFISFSFIPKVVTVGVPRRMPEGSYGLRVSNGIVFFIHYYSRLFPIFSLASFCRLYRDSMYPLKNKCVSVPPEIISQPFSFNSFCQDFSIFYHLFCIFLKTRPHSASFKAAAIAALGPGVVRPALQAGKKTAPIYLFS